MKRIFTSLLTAVLLLFMVVPASAFAAAGLVLSADTLSMELKAGQTFEVPIHADVNSGYIVGAVDVTWNSSALMLKSVKYSEELAPKNNAADVTNSGSYRLNFGSYLVKENYTGTGVFFTLEFEITAAAAAGTYPIKLTNAGIYDKDIKAVSAEMRSGSVTLTNGGELKLAAGNAEAIIGTDKEIEIPVSATANPGYATGLVDVRWDTSQLKLKDVKYNETLAPKNNAADVTNSGSYRANFGSYIATDNFKETGVFFTLVFEITDTATEGSTTVQLCSPEALSKDAVKLAVTVSSGTVKLAKKAETTTTTTTTATSITTSTSATTSAPVTTTTSATTSALVTSSTSATTSAPVTTSTSAATSAPVTTSTSATTSTPVTSSTSATTSTPVATSTSATTSAPVTTSTSAATSAPVTTSSSAVTSAPVTSSTSATTSAPVTSSTSATTSAPVTTSTSATTSAPVTTSTSATTSTPVTTSTSATTSAPVTSSTSATTSAPVTTSTSAATSAPVTTSTSATTSAIATSSSSTTSVTGTTLPPVTNTGSTTSATGTTSPPVTDTGSTTSGTQTTSAVQTGESGTSTTSTSATTVTGTSEPELKPWMIGDLDKDGKAIATDAALLLKLYAELSSGSRDATTEEIYICDVNRNGKIEAGDAAFILKYYAEASGGYDKTIDVYLKEVLNIL